MNTEGGFLGTLSVHSISDEWITNMHPKWCFHSFSTTGSLEAVGGRCGGGIIELATATKTLQVCVCVCIYVAFC